MLRRGHSWRIDPPQPHGEDLAPIRFESCTLGLQRRLAFTLYFLLAGHASSTTVQRYKEPSMTIRFICPKYNKSLKAPHRSQHLGRAFRSTPEDYQALG